MSTDESSAAGQSKRSRELSEEVCSQVKRQRKKKEMKKKVVDTVLTGSKAHPFWNRHSDGIDRFFLEVDPEQSEVYTPKDDQLHNLRPILGGACVAGRLSMKVDTADKGDTSDKGDTVDEDDEDYDDDWKDDDWTDVKCCLHVLQRKSSHHDDDSLVSLKRLTQEAYDHFVAILPEGARVTVERAGEITVNTEDGVFDVIVELQPN